MWWTIPITVERLTGHGPYGDTYAAKSTEYGRLRRARKLVRDMAGEEVVASATWSGPLDTVDIPPGSRVTLPGETTPRTVIASARHEALPATPNFYSIEVE